MYLLVSFQPSFLFRAQDKFAEAEKILKGALELFTREKGEDDLEVE